MNEPLISIVLNNYNYEKYVGKAIESALSQTYPYVEIVIVDDGSTDNSRNIIASYSVDKTYFKENGGQVSALNLGFQKCTGDVIIFLDSDDWLFDNACQEIANAYSTKSEAYQYKLATVNSAGKPLGRILPSELLSDENHQDFVCQHGYIPTAPMSGMAFSKIYLQNCFPFDTSIWNNALDGYLMYVAAVSGKIKSINQVLGSYRIHPNSLSEHGNISLKKTRQMLEMEYLYAEGIHQRIRVEKVTELREISTLLGPYHWKNRLDSFLLDKSGHVFEQDSKNRIVAELLKHFITAPEIGIIKKAKNILIYLVVYFLSEKNAKALVGKINRYSDVSVN